MTAAGTSWGELTRYGLLLVRTAMLDAEPPRAPKVFTEDQALAWRLGWEEGRRATQDDIRADIRKRNLQSDGA